MEQTKKALEQKEFYLKVSRLVGEIQQLGTLLTLSTKFHVKVDFTPHVKWLEVCIYEKKQDFIENENGIESGYIILEIDEEHFFNETPQKQQRTIKRLMKIKRKLIDILKEKEVDYGKIDYTIKTIEYKQYVI